MLPVSLVATLATQDEEKTEGTINNGQSRDTVNIGHTRRRENRRDNHQYSLRLVCPMLPVSLDCPLLIAPSVFSSSCVATIASVSGLSIVDCLFFSFSVISVFLLSHYDVTEKNVRLMLNNNHSLALVYSPFRSIVM
jgi:hypothetical protein